MKLRISRMLAFAGVAALVSAGCNVNPQQANEAAQRVMTVAAQITPGAVETVIASSPLGTIAPAAPMQAPIVYARCITRDETELLQLPSAGATAMAALASRSIITAFGRTADATWVLGWDAGDVRGWLPAAILGCTAPVQDLLATDAGFLLTPTVAVTAQPTFEATSEGTAEATLPPASALTGTATMTPETTPGATLEMAATEAATQSATETPFPSATTATTTETPLPATTTSAPTALPTSTSAPGATAVPASAATPARVITVVVTATPSQVRDLRCVVTPGTPVNLRNGPARTDPLLDTMPAGTRFLAQGRNTDATWLYGFTEFQMPGWLIASSVQCDGDPAQLVEVDR